MTNAVVGRLLLFILLISPLPLQAKLQVVTELSPPNQTIENHQVAGSSTDLVKAILKAAELEGQFSIYPWARAFKLAQHDKYTLIYSIAKTPAREDSFHWIGPVAVFHLGFVTNRYREDIKIQSLEDAKQYKIAVQRGDIAEGTLKALGFNFVQTSDIEKSYELLVANRVDLVIDDPRYIKTMATELNLPADHFTFLYDVEALSVKGYLATNNQLPADIVERLRIAFAKVSKTETYRKVLEL
ncbi:transporter substrate-binding domain-containing protein [Pseudoalteromonas sp. S2755]|uniref:substrate-binding periplasmic protein n=1 Tax=Pseudoalteromonas sp. S2755 TaxID=2066523 RepID=UPI00110B1698|nr:transporter substrate-binding domain-containing protein [Pseudoalteromonas sp. S2755]TMN36330.1 amino acid ABC transporter substrate-binding protein [Pseudoalteromonas sp. S2755]